MALIALGQSACGICGEPLRAADDLVAFPSLVANRRDPLYFVNDAGFHRRCFEAHPLAGAALARAAEARSRAGPGHRQCAVCQREITGLDDYFGAGFLTDDQDLAAFKFNYVQLHRSHYTRWEQAADFESALRALTSSAAYDGPVLAFDPLPLWKPRAGKS